MFSTFDNKLSVLDSTYTNPASRARNSFTQPSRTNNSFQQLTTTLTSAEIGNKPNEHALPRISNVSFVGISSRSKHGCMNCRKKKKKCDEEWPVCGLCQKKNIECVPRDPSVRKDKNIFDFANILESQKLIEIEKSKKRKRSAEKSECTPKFVSKRRSSSSSSSGSSIGSNAGQEPFPEQEVKVEPNPSMEALIPLGTLEPLESGIAQTTPLITGLSPLSPDSLEFNTLSSNLIRFINSPRFQAQSDSPSSPASHLQQFNQPPRFKNIDNFHFVEELSQYSIQHNKSSFSSVESDDEWFLPMDESQVIENQYLSDSELLSDLQMKDMVTYFKPSLHQMFSNIVASPTLITPSSTLIRSLDDTGLLFLDHYVTYIVDAITVCGRTESNFFLNYLLQLACVDDAVLNGVVAWGGLFLMGSQNEYARKYFYKSLSLVNTKKDKPIKDRTNEDYMILLSAYIILTGAEISTGDIKYWYHMFLQFQDVLSDYGGLLKFFNNNKQSNEGKWIISNYFFHDIMSTRTLSTGTHTDMAVYKEIFQNQKVLELDRYGLDPFQGSSPEIFLIFGDIISKGKELRDMKLKIEYMRSNLGESSSESVRSRALQAVEQLTQECSIFSEEAFHELSVKISEAKPSAKQLAELEGNQEMMTLHLAMFELFQVTFHLYLLTSIRTTDFRDSELQRYKREGDRLFDSLIGTKLQSSMCFPLLLLGLPCYTEWQRTEMTARYERLISHYEVRNVRRCWFVIQRCWKLLDERVASDDTDFTVDWCNVVDDFGWEFCFS